MANEYVVSQVAAEVVESTGSGTHRVVDMAVEVLFSGLSEAQVSDVWMEVLVSNAGGVGGPARVSNMWTEVLMALTPATAGRRRAAQIIG